MRKNLFSGIILAGLFLPAWAQQDTIADQRLQEVVVTAKLPLAEMSAGKITYRMDASITQSSGNLYEVLSSLPGVTIDSGGNVLLNGQGGAKILIDGKSTYLSGEELLNLLKSTPATNTDKIDLITHPSARYDAADNAGIIDIRTRKIKQRGMNLILNGNGSLGKSGGGFGSASVNLREDKFNYYLTYSYYQGKERIDMEIDHTYGKDGGRIWQDSRRERDNSSHYLRTGFDFYATDRTVWGVSFSGDFFGRKEDAAMFSDILQTETEGWTYSHTTRDRTHLSAGTSLTHRLLKEGGEVNAAFDYFHYRHDENQFMHTFKPDTLKGDMRGNINLYAGQADMSYPLGDKWKLHGGGKISSVAIDNTAGYLRPSASGWIADGSLGFRFVYDESIYAAYSQVDYGNRRLKFSVGLRLEHTSVRGESSGNTLQRDSSFAMNYIHLFPTFSLQYDLPSGDAWQFSYGRRITRPNYADLNPFTYIFDDYTYEGGNTKLRPSFSDNLEWAYMHRNRLQAALFFSYTDDVIMKSYQERGDQCIYVMPDNLSSCMQVGVRLHAAGLSVTPWWAVDLLAIGVYNDYHWWDSGEKVTSRKLTPIAGCMNRFTITPTWSAELAANYNGRMAYGHAIVHPISEVNLGIRKKVLDGKGTISLFAKDVFNTNYNKADIHSPGMRAFLDERNNKRVVGIAFSWRFQKGSETKENRRKSTVDETKRVNL